jgi:acyl-coenzyme A thioesterase 13
VTFLKEPLSVTRVCTCTRELTIVIKHSDFKTIVGKTLAYTSVQFYNSKGQLAARGSHTKYFLSISPSLNISLTSISRFVSGTLGPDGAYVAPAEWADDLD